MVDLDVQQFEKMRVGQNEQDKRGIVLQHLLTAQDDPHQIEEREDGFVVRRSLHMLGKVYIEASGLCNLTCRTCIRNVMSKDFGLMDQEVFEKILSSVRMVSPAPAIFFGGFGEPLTHPHIVEWVAQARQVSPSVELITNGVLLDEQRAQGLLESGLTGLWVSLDAASAENYADIRLGSTLDNVLHNMERLRLLAQRASRDKIKIGLVFVAMKSNLAELPKLIQMSFRLGISRYLVTNLMPYNPQMCTQILYARSADRLDIPPNPWSPFVDLPPMDREALTGNSALLSRLLPNPSQNRCPFIERGSTAIAWNGAVSPCLPLMVDHISYLGDLRREVNHYHVGNLKEQTLMEIWQDSDYLAFRKKVRDFDFAPCTACASCEKAESNQEDCFGNTFPTCGGCLWAQGFIRCP